MDIFRELSNPWGKPTRSVELSREVQDGIGA